MCGNMFTLKDMAIFQTLQTCIGHNSARYHKVNPLPNALPHTLPYISSQFYMDRP